MSTYFIGATFIPQADWRAHARVPTAPANYKNREKIAEYVEAAAEAQMAQAAMTAITGKLSSVCVLDERQEVRYCSSAEDTQVGPAFVSWLLERSTRAFRRSYA